MSTSNGSDSAPNLRILSPLTEDIHNRASEDNLREDEPDDDRPQARTLQEARAQKDPWAPIVLSLDGGGIKGLSELFILLKIMDEISSLIRVESNPEDAALFAFLNDPTLLPCYFFDFMVGTSTGGLIAVMLGRLRMSIPDAIKAYWCFGNDIFRPRRFIRSYSSTKLKDAVVRVIRSNCGCHVTGTGCCDMEPLRQYDFVEKDDLSYRGRNGWRNLNFTCKTALVAQRKEKGAQVTHLFRSYNHTQRFEGDLRELNPRTIGRYNLRIWQACRASSAAPLYFKKMKIDPDEFLDGGVGNNNPSDIAWFEAKLMLKPLLGSRTTPDNRKVAAMVSLGCGEKEKHSMFGNQRSLFFVWEAWKYGKSKISDTETVDKTTRTLADESPSAYYRFSVKPPEGNDGKNGLGSIKLADCKKKKKKRTKNNPWSVAGESEPPEQYIEWLREAIPRGNERKKGVFKPDKYQYLTFDEIFSRTKTYCETNNPPGLNVKGDIEECARTLLVYARARYSDNPERWKCHVSHPHPSHSSYILSDWRTQASK